MINNIKELLIRLTEIPAPTGQESLRAIFIKEWLLDNGISGGTIDDAGNLIYKKSVDEDKYLLMAAHLDTVFNDEAIKVKEDNNRLLAPGIGDDTSNVAVLMWWMKEYYNDYNRDLLIAFDVGEEGLGNLKGIRAIVDRYGEDIEAAVALDLTYNVIHNKAVGSSRYKVRVNTEGGHSWHDFGNESAIIKAADMISKIGKIKVPDEQLGSLSYNVGTIKGGTSVNTIPSEVEFLMEVRSTNKELMGDYSNKLLDIVRDAKVETVGIRPCGIDVDTDKKLYLEQLAEDSITRITGIMPLYEAGSMDYNIPLSMGIPSISFGLYDGGLYHTYDEWVDIDSLNKGMIILKEFMSQYNM